MRGRAASVAETIRRRNDEAAGALIGYLPVGFPDLPTSIDAAVAMAENGVDAIELGVPYSDPVMDGPVIQKATQAALAAGFRLRHSFEAVREIRARVDVPVLVMTYFNPVLQYGIERFATGLLEAGGSGLITPDLIPDEAVQWRAVAERLELDRVFLAAPSSTDVRLRHAVEASRGFVYAVSTMGVTGARAGVDSAARLLVERLRRVGSTSVCVGLGVSTGDQVAEILAYADGAIVGSALVRALASGGVPAVAEVSRALSEGTRVRSER
ncbi:tryptophan synthase subunit alpha [Rathayibacter toxicus]|uniref:Tryptophan synthase alpha chain n=1 Tax=Rathayibacter toxicus TaxID=145458 RepID=A0A0C5BST4_9MICO|nr:tryptophan synthase subunit alpha [Rathayibacter toxicus]AJM77757.1 tryptophan synthase alpha chain [Rathayibacter toxicus]ALS58075.1 tryptophan synthase subunit alpha [Rathayibacter toxicus]KKM45287.1 tryptophan synthase alpha chain [Rathayibacter toxicus]PPG21892.1 tryptophan synthase subunit alpha [Rathayibacter toxicus]PPG46854.1 tryptophan synthase subunit alpha [Rathayibacter toxicus]